MENPQLRQIAVNTHGWAMSALEQFHSKFQRILVECPEPIPSTIGGALETEIGSAITTENNSSEGIQRIECIVVGYIPGSGQLFPQLEPTPDYFQVEVPLRIEHAFWLAISIRKGDVEVDRLRASKELRKFVLETLDHVQHQHPPSE